MARRLVPAGCVAALLLLTAAPGAVRRHVDAQTSIEAPRLFRTGAVCTACHNSLVSPLGEDVSIGSDWRASMMANSSRDPYWQAAVRREVMDHPAARESIEDECSTCHMPMARTQAVADGVPGEVFAHLPIDAARDPGSALAADGVSCTLCHQIEDRNLGGRESFSGGYVIDRTRPWGERLLYGPFDVDSGRQRVMHSASRFIPTRGTHLQESRVCATCHELHTPTLDSRGVVVDTLPEQVPFQEWEHSAYRERQSCQACHMPVVEEDVALTRVLGIARQGVSRHTFVGGNFFVLRMLNRYRAELGVEALPREMEAAATRTEETLRTRTARLEIDRVGAVRGALEFELLVTNLTGHKLPTAYPSRRAWLHVTVRDRAGRVLFESGALRRDGSVVGNDNDVDGARYEPHYAEIDAPDEVQIYESIMVSPAGAVTTGLLTASGYVKDNRLLPLGFDKGSANEDIAVRGTAVGDGDFQGGGDRVRYRVPVGADAGPLRIEAELLYQPIGFRWAENLRPYAAPEPARFVRYYQSMSERSAAVLASAAAAVP